MSTKREILTFDVSTPDLARAFLDGEHACIPCLLTGAYCGGSGYDCRTTWEANDLLVAADAAAKRAAKTYPKGHDVVPDHATSPYPCGREAMHHAGACECHGYHP